LSYFFLQIAGKLIEMIDSVAEVFRRLGYSSEQISDDQEFLKRVIIVSVIKT